MTIISELQIEARLQLDIEDTAKRIEYEFVDSLLPTPKGIYVINKVEPVMTDGIEYYTLVVDKNNKIKRTIVTDITKLEQAIYTATTGEDRINQGGDKIVIPKAFMLNKSKYISNSPIMPYRGVKITHGLINHQIDSFIKYRKSSKTGTDIIKSNLIKLQKEELVSTLSRINELYEDIHSMIRQFMGVHDWHLYFIKINEAKITIEKSIDYRAYQWILQEEEKKDLLNARGKI